MKLKDLHNGDIFECSIRDGRTFTRLTFVMQREDQLKSPKIILYNDRDDKYYIVSTETDVTLVDRPNKIRNFSYTKEE